MQRVIARVEVARGHIAKTPTASNGARGICRGSSMVELFISTILFGIKTAIILNFAENEEVGGSNPSHGLRAVAQVVERRKEVSCK